LVTHETDLLKPLKTQVQNAEKEVPFDVFDTPSSKKKTGGSQFAVRS